MWVLRGVLRLGADIFSLKQSFSDALIVRTRVFFLSTWRGEAASTRRGEERSPSFDPEGDGLRLVSRIHLSKT